jgi:hypothetical protein
MENKHIWSGRYTVDLCFRYPDRLFVFGDNLARVGKGGQAIIRECYNSHGIATKVLPTNEDKAFFIDSDMFKDIIYSEVDAMCCVAERKGLVITLPNTGIGTGLSKLNTVAPECFKLLNDLLSEVIGSDYCEVVKQTHMKVNKTLI